MVSERVAIGPQSKKSDGGYFICWRSALQADLLRVVLNTIPKATSCAALPMPGSDVPSDRSVSSSSSLYRILFCSVLFCSALLCSALAVRTQSVSQSVGLSLSGSVQRVSLPHHATIKFPPLALGRVLPGRAGSPFRCSGRLQAPMWRRAGAQRLEIGQWDWPGGRCLRSGRLYLTFWSTGTGKQARLRARAMQPTAGSLLF